MDFFVIKNKHSGKFATPQYGWEGEIENENQIFDSSHLPYIPNEDMEFIRVGKDQKPSLKSVQLQLGLLELS